VRFGFLWRIFKKKDISWMLRDFGFECEIFYWEVTFLRGFIEYYIISRIGI
jgi:hypothetical protein